MKRTNSIFCRYLMLGALMAFSGCLAQAGSVLWWIDDEPGTSVVPGAISLAGDTGTEATSDTNFDSLLTSQSWSAVIIGIQDHPFDSYDASLDTDLTNYVQNGGLLIGADWIPTDADFYALFQASPVGANDASITNDGSPVFTNITGNIGISNNSAWGTYDQSYSPTGSATGFGPSGSGFGIIEATNGSGITYLDGPLFDSYTDLSQGEQLVANELGGGTSTPEPGTFVLLAGGFAGLALRAARKKRLANR